MEKGEGLRIDSSTIGMESARSYRASKTTIRHFSIMDYQEDLAQGNNALNAAIDEEEEDTAAAEGGKQNVTTMQEWRIRFQAQTSNVSIRSSAEQTFTEIQEYTIRYIFDLLFAARRNQLNRWLEVNGANTRSVQNAEGELNTGAATGMTVMNYSQEMYFEEVESTSFSTVGTVKTADGREINFNVNVGMSRQFQEYYQNNYVSSAIALCDPLVINLDTDVAQLDDQTFFFDIDADGEKDEIAQLGAGSGYLALDKNQDGSINDGSELFGTKSGDGFADLARYDEDGNGWIDEGDAIWDKLQIWTRDANGKEVLYRLSEKGVGAICLQNAATDFTQKGATGQTLGIIRSTGVFLYENGNVGTVQHLDVAK